MWGKMCWLFFSDFKADIGAENATLNTMPNWHRRNIITNTDNMTSCTRNNKKSDYRKIKLYNKLKKKSIDRKVWQSKREETWTFRCKCFDFSRLFLMPKSFIRIFRWLILSFASSSTFFTKIEIGTLSFLYENMNVNMEMWYFINIYFL